MIPRNPDFERPAAAFSIVVDDLRRVCEAATAIDFNPPRLHHVRFETHLFGRAKRARDKARTRRRFRQAHRSKR